VVVDAGMRPDAAYLFRSALEETSHLPVRFLCVTHYHADHVFGLAPFKDVTLFGSARVMENMKRSPDWSSEALAKWKTNDPEAGEWLDQWNSSCQPCCSRSGWIFATAARPWNSITPAAHQLFGLWLLSRGGCAVRR